MAQLTTQQDFERLLFRDAEGRYGATLADYRLHSAFQPLCYRGGSVFGYEALLRVFDARQQPLRPDLFFASLDPGVAIDADRLARVIHIRNFAQSGLRCCLSLNIMPQTLAGDVASHDNFELLQRRLGQLGLDKGSVILEVLEYEVEGREQLMVDCLRVAADAGFGVAVDDFGAMASGHQRVRALRPDIIKIDRSLLLDYMAGDTRHLPKVLDFGWQMGSRMLVEGIETAEQHAAMQALNVELYQGFHLGRPGELGVERLL